MMIIVIIMMITIRRVTSKRDRNKTQEKTSDAQRISSPPADQCPASPQAATAPPGQLPPVYIVSTTTWGMEYPGGMEYPCG